MLLSSKPGLVFFILSSFWLDGKVIVVYFGLEYKLFPFQLSFCIDFKNLKVREMIRGWNHSSLESGSTVQFLHSMNVYHSVFSRFRFCNVSLRVYFCSIVCMVYNWVRSLPLCRLELFHGRIVQFTFSCSVCMVCI